MSLFLLSIMGTVVEVGRRRRCRVWHMILGRREDCRRLDVDTRRQGSLQHLSRNMDCHVPALAYRVLQVAVVGTLVGGLNVEGGCGGVFWSW